MSENIEACNADIRMRLALVEIEQKRHDMLIELCNLKQLIAEEEKIDRTKKNVVMALIGIAYLFLMFFICTKN
jgi:hypothetical protein